MVRTWKLRSVLQWFTEIEKGTKTIEGRLTMEGLQSGDLVEFECFDKHVTKQVVGVRSYYCFADMLDNEDLAKIMPGIKTIPKAAQIYASWYPFDLQINKQVIAIELTDCPKQQSVDITSR